MRVIHHHDGAVFFGEVAEARKRSNVAVHGEDAVSDEQLAAGLVFDAGELFFGVAEVLMIKNENLRAREARAINNGRVIQLVRDDEVFFAQNRRHRSRIRRES